MRKNVLLDHIRKLPHGRANLKQLLRELGRPRFARQGRKSSRN